MVHKPCTRIMIREGDFLLPKEKIKSIIGNSTPHEVCMVLSQDDFCKDEDISKNTIDKIDDENGYVDKINGIDTSDRLVEIIIVPSKGEHIKISLEKSILFIPFTLRYDFFNTSTIDKRHIKHTPSNTKH